MADALLSSQVSDRRATLLMLLSFFRNLQRNNQSKMTLVSQPWKARARWTYLKHKTKRNFKGNSKPRKDGREFCSKCRTCKKLLLDKIPICTCQQIRSKCIRGMCRKQKSCKMHISGSIRSDVNPIVPDFKNINKKTIMETIREKMVLFKHCTNSV